MEHLQGVKYQFMKSSDYGLVLSFSKNWRFIAEMGQEIS